MSASERAAAKPLVLLCGEEEYVKRTALKEILTAAGMDKEDFDLETFDGQSTPPSAWIASAETAPFLAERRTVIIRHLLQCDFEKTKGVAFKNLPSHALLILVADDEGGSDDRVSRLKTSLQKWEKLVTAASGAVLKFDPDPQATKQAVKAEVTRQGKKIADRAADALIEMTGGSLSRSLEELEKVLLFLGDSESVTDREIRAVVVPSREWNVFKMTDAIAAGRVAEALRHLRILVGGRNTPEDAAYRSVLPMMSRNLRLLWQGCLCIEAGCTPNSAPPEILKLFPDKLNLAREQGYRQTQVMSAAKKSSRSRLVRSFQVLADADTRLKGGLPGFSSIETLERMILEMADAT